MRRRRFGEQIKKSRQPIFEVLTLLQKLLIEQLSSNLRTQLAFKLKY